MKKSKKKIALKENDGDSEENISAEVEKVVSDTENLENGDSNSQCEYHIKIYFEIQLNSFNFYKVFSHYFILLVWFCFIQIFTRLLVVCE